MASLSTLAEPPNQTQRKSARHWLTRYLREVRPLLCLDTRETTLFLTGHGTAFHPNALSAQISQHLKQSGLNRIVLLETVPCDIGYAGMYRDAITGLYYTENGRIYDPATGRFTTRDPIGIAGGLNLYEYAKNSPINFTDRSGYCPLLAVEAAVGIAALALKEDPELPQQLEEGVTENGKVQADAVCQRIEWLISNHLKKIASSKQWGDWETLYQDPDDGRYWERTFSQSEVQGGGPPCLVVFPVEQVREKYQI